MDPAEDGQEGRIPDQSDEGGSVQGGSVGEAGSGPAESAGSVGSVKPRIKWMHDKDLSLNNLRPGLELMKTALEKTIDGHKAQMNDLRRKMGPYSR